MLGYESAVINSQLVPVPPVQGYAPLTFGQTFTGPGYWPRNGPYNVPPIVPSPLSGGSGAAMSSSGVISGMQPTPTSGAVDQQGNINWFHPTKSPLLWALGFLIVGLLMLHHIHFK